MRSHLNFRNAQQIQRYTTLTPAHAQGYLTLAVNTWVFQGPQLINGVMLPNQDRITRISHEIYFHILSFLTYCSLNDTKDIFNMTNKRICNGFMHNRKSYFFKSYNPKIENIENVDPETKERYHNRVAFLNSR